MRGARDAVSSRPEASRPASRIRPTPTAVPRGAWVTKDRKMPEMRAETDSTKISGPRAAGEERAPPATASAITAALIPAASQVRAGQRNGDSPAVTGPAG